MTLKVGLRTLKTGVGATLAIILANQIGLKYSLSAGIITILSIQNTKKKSLTLTKQRIGSTLLALGLASVLFTLLGYNAFAFGIYLLLFIPLTVQFNLTDGIVVSSVLVTHLLGEQSVSLSLLLNECLLVIIGAGVGILLNLYMPSLEQEIKEAQSRIELQMKEIFLQLATTIKSQTVGIQEEQAYQDLYQTLQHAHEKATQNQDNMITSQRLYYVQYMEMRLLQYHSLHNMRQTLGRVCMTADQSLILATLTEDVAKGLTEHNDAKGLIAKTEEILALFRAQPLPLTREEFETRAMLFQYLNELISLLEIKQSFRAHLSASQLEAFGCSSI